MTAPAVSEYAFVALGRPATAGSHRAFVINGKARLVPADKKQRPWQETVHSAAIDAGCIPLEGPLWVELTFRLPKPASAPKRRRIWPTGARAATSTSWPAPVWTRCTESRSSTTRRSSG
jgi:hypothetical protein